MSRARDSVREQIRRRGSWTAGLLQQASAVGGDVNTAGRPHDRAALPLLPGNSSNVGVDNLFLLGPGGDMPTHAGTWPYVV